MKYYIQRNKTDCLLACAENFVQCPREEFGGLQWFDSGYGKFLKYESLANVLTERGGGKILFEGTVHLDYKPAILGNIYTVDYGTVCHSLFWDGKKAFCPHLNRFVGLAELDISYIILNANFNHPNAMTNINTIFKNWDEGVQKRFESKDIKLNGIASLITLNYDGKVYPGDLERANIKRQLNQK